MALSSADIKKIKEAFNSGNTRTAKEFAKDIQKENSKGRHMIDMIDVYIASGNPTLDELLTELTVVPKPPKP